MELLQFLPIFVHTNQRRMNNNIGKHILTIVLFLSSLVTMGQNYAITQRGERGTLNDNFVHCIYKDSDGFIWVGTGTSVERYDGVYNLSYEYEGGGRPNVYAGSLVNALMETQRHELWVGNIRGLWRLNHSTRLAERMFPEQINCPVQALEKDSRNHLYIGTTNGLYVYDGKQLHHSMIDVKSIYPDDNQVMGISVSDTNNSWLLTIKGIALYESKSGTAKTYPNTLPECGRFLSLQRVNETLYIGTEKRGIVTFDLKTYRFSPYWEEIRVPVTQLSYEGGLLGASTKGEGICLISLQKKQLVYTATYQTDKKKGLLSNKISSILLTQGNIWCGTDYYLGMNFLRNVQVPFRLYEKKDFTTRDIAIRSTLQHDGYTYIGTREGFYCITESDGTVRFFESEKNGAEKLRSNLIFSLYPYEGQVLVGTCLGGMSAFNPHTGTFTDTPLTERLTSNDVFMCVEDEEGKLWIAASDGLYGYDCRTKQVSEYNTANSGMPGNIVYGIYIDSTGRFWVGTDKGLAQFDASTGKCSQEQLPEGIRKDGQYRYISEGRDGTLFFFLLPNIVYTADKELKNFRRLLPTIGSYSMNQDADGFYWFATDFGIVKADEKLADFSLSSLNDLIDLETGCSPGALVQKNKKGEMWFSTTKGLVVADPKRAIHASPIRITEVLVNGEHFASNYDVKTDSILSLGKNSNNVTFRFVSLGYENPELTRYEYRLEGRDSTWQQVMGKNEISFYNLPGGHYTFRVRKMLNDSTADRLAFSIEEKSVWEWYAGGVLVLGVFVYLLMRKRKISAMVATTKTPADNSVVAEASLEEKAEASSSSENYVKLSDEEAQKVIDALKAYMEKDKPYLNVDLKQSEVAAAIGCSSHLLSAIFTYYLKTGYYEFINAYRVEELKQAIKAGQHEKYTLVTLAEKCGFKSKSSFFRTFKKFTGVTPNEYIQQQEKH